MLDAEQLEELMKSANTDMLGSLGDTFPRILPQFYLNGVRVREKVARALNSVPQDCVNTTLFRIGEVHNIIFDKLYLLDERNYTITL